MMTGRTRIALALVLPLVLGCQGAEVDRLKAQLASTIADRDRAQQQLRAAIVDRDRSKKELDDFKVKAIISDEHAMFDEAEGFFADENWEQAAIWYRNFTAHYPESKMLGRARQQLKIVEKRLAEAEKHRQEQEVAAKLSGVSVAEIYANIERYKGKTITRTLKCHAPETLFAEMGDYQTGCTIDSVGDTRVLYRSKDIKLLASLPRDELGRFSYAGVFKILDTEVQGSGIVLKFVALAGQ